MCGGRISFSHAYSKNKSQRPSPIRSTTTECPQWSVQSPGRSDFRDLVGMRCRYLCSGKKHGSPLYFLNCFQNWIAGLGLPVPQGEIDAVRPAFRLVGEDVLLETRKPQRTGHAPYPGEHIRPIDGVQSE